MRAAACRGVFANNIETPRRPAGSVRTMTHGRAATPLGRFMYRSLLVVRVHLESPQIMKEIIHQLKELGGQDNSGELDVIVASSNASQERRIAAVLWMVALSGKPIAQSVLELIMSLTEPQWDKSITDPFDVEMGRTIVDMVNKETIELRDIAADNSATNGQRGAARLILLALADDVEKLDSFNIILKVTTGRDTRWWYEWIRNQRS